MKDFPTFLRVATPFNPPLFDVKKNEDGTTELVGTEAKMLEILAKFLKFEYQLISYKEDFGVELPDGNWTGVVGMLIRDEIDLAIGELAITKDRLKVIDFSIPYAWEEVIFLMRHPGPSTKPSMATVLLPYDFTVWCCILVLILLMPLVFIILLKLKGDYVQLLLDMVGNLLFQGTKLRSDTAYGRILSGFWSLSGSILAFGYCAVLLSFLTVPPDERGIRNLKELSVAVDAGTHRCLTLKASAIIQSLVTSEKDYIRNLGQTVVRNKWYIDTTVYKNTIRKYDAVLLAHSLGFLLFGHPLTSKVKWKYLDADSYVLVKSEDYLVSWILGMGVQKGFCCKDKLDLFLLRVLSSGIYQEQQALQFYKSHVLQMWKSDPWREGVAKISLTHSAGTFKILFSGYIIAFIVLLLENIISYFERNLKIRLNTNLAL